MSASDAVNPAIITITPYSTNNPPMIRRMSNNRAAVADLVSSSVISLWRSLSRLCSDMLSQSSRGQNENGM